MVCQTRLRRSEAQILAHKQHFNALKPCRHRPDCMLQLSILTSNRIRLSIRMVRSDRQLRDRDVSPLQLAALRRCEDSRQQLSAIIHSDTHADEADSRAMAPKPEKIDPCQR